MINDERLVITIDHDNDIIATRSKTSVQLNKEDRIVRLLDVEYSVDEVIAIAQKLEDMGLSNKLTFS